MKKMKGKNILTVLFLALMLCTAISFKTKAASKAKYSYKTVDISKTFDNGRVKANVYYKKPVLKGKTPAVKKINAAISRDCQRFLNSDSVDNLYGYTQSAVDNKSWDNMKIDFYYYATSSVSYNRKGIISIKVSTYWNAGGVNNCEEYGLNYNLRTGKKLYLTDVCSGGSAKIKGSILNEIRKDREADTMKWELLNGYKLKKMQFYLEKNNRAVVTFKPYEINYGGWNRNFIIRSKYK